jgi:two-component system cell cycle response regulator DivK
MMNVRARDPDMVTNDPKTRILLIEDDFDTQEIYRAFLEHAGYEVLTADDGEEGVDRAIATIPDLILLDIMLPKIPGWEVAQLLRDDDRTRKVPIIAVSAYELPGERDYARELGVDRFLKKPLPPTELVDEVKRHFERIPEA